MTVLLRSRVPATLLRAPVGSCQAFGAPVRLLQKGRRVIAVVCSSGRATHGLRVVRSRWATTLDPCLLRAAPPLGPSFHPSGASPLLGAIPLLHQLRQILRCTK